MRILIILIALCAILPASAQIPSLQKSGQVTHMMVQGKPFLMIGGELHNSTSSSIDYMEKLDIWGTIEKAHYNTVIASASWELVEPEEGRFNFEQVDYLINNARERNLKLVLIWFASWKNGASTYVPGWVKRNPKKYRYVQNSKGELLNVVSPVQNEAAMQADARAFAGLMQHIRETDPDHTVIMMQVENEVGVLSSVRDFSPEAQKAWKGDVPADLITYLQAHKGKLFPELEKVWAANGYKTKGNWETIFGVSTTNTDDWKAYPYYSEELFMAYHYAKYIGTVAAMGKKEKNLPMYCNAWLKQPSGGYPGKFPSGGPLPEVLDVWRAAAPSVDFLAPDIYTDEFDYTLKQFSLGGNPFLIPESTFEISKELYAIGAYHVLGFCPFGIDVNGGDFSMAATDDKTLDNLYRGNALLRNMDQLILAQYGTENLRGIYVDEVNPKASLEFGEYLLDFSLSAPSGSTQNDGTGTGFRKSRKNGGALVLRAGPETLYILGKDIRIAYRLKEAKTGQYAATESVEEGRFVNNQWVPGRRINGDEQYFVSFGDVKAVKVVLYKAPFENRMLF